MNTAILLTDVIPKTLEWSPTVGGIMIACNVLAFIVGRSTIKYPNVGPELPGSGAIGGVSIPALLATTSFGHIVGTGVILGLNTRDYLS
ncbi:MAG: photosystem I reaction center subunit PsaK [Leptolyngbyaceae cyanobacterium SL_7_1]|nr:photosystem I reaction center subunit PsaK [Leptolyngbyaceae cyanobacterium SL_7_1]